jgi:hypothetical protein
MHNLPLAPIAVPAGRELAMSAQADAPSSPHAQPSPPYLSGPAFKMRPGCSPAESASAGPSVATAV